MTTTPDVLLFADGGRASTTAPQRSTLERDHQLQRIPVDRPHCVLMNPITEAGRETATERDKLSTDSLARARAAILHLGAAADQPPKGIISARGRTHPQLPDEVGRTALLQQPAPPSSGNLELPSASPRKPPGRDTPARSITNTARLANEKRTPRRSRPSAAGLQLAPDPRPCRTHLQFLQGPHCSRHSDLPDILAPEAAGLSGVPTATIRLRFSDRRLASTPRSHITAVHVETTAALKAQRSLPSKGR